VECAFGILSNKWSISQRPDIVNACVVLNNFVRETDGYKFGDAMTVNGLEHVPDGQSVRMG
jgi:hypothetical protein